MVVYLDCYFVLNLIIDYLSLYSAGILCGVYSGRIRLLSAALIGALYSCFALLADIPLYISITAKTASVLLLVTVGFGTGRNLPRLCAAFLVMSFLLGGICFAIGIDRALPIVLISVSLAISSKSLFNGLMRSGAKGGYSDIVIRKSGRSLRLRALRDTGATITDPVTGMGVMIVSPYAAAELFEKKVADIIKRGDIVDYSSTLCELSSAGQRFRLIPYRAVGVEQGMLLAFKPDEIRVDGEVRDDLMVAISPNDISDNAAYSALLRVN